MLAGRAREEAAKRLDSDDLWWHRSDKPKLLSDEDQVFAYSLNSTRSNKVKGSLDSLTAPLVKILSERGFSVGMPSGYGSATNRSFTAPRVNWTKDVADTLEEYSAVTRQGMRIIQAIEALRREWAQSDVGALWDSL
jgi:hypothetical protein